jgi:regulator of sirC expression with transglutaminase-like and TPR domain
VSRRCALIVNVRGHGHPVSEAWFSPGEAVDLSPRGPLLLPSLPGDRGWATVAWRGRDQVEVVDNAGHHHRLGPEGSLELEAGPVRLHLQLAPQQRLRRAPPAAWSGSVAWLTVVLASALVFDQGAFLYERRCLWFGVDCPQPDEGATSGINAEYLARILRKDYAGDVERGVIVDLPPVHLHEVQVTGFMPAGDTGPVTMKGGAAETAPEPERRAAAEAVLPPAPKEKPRLSAVPEGTPMAEAEPAKADGVADVAEGVTPDPAEEPVTDPSEGRKEEAEGWGLRDWLDAAVKVDKVIVEEAVRDAKRRVVINPDSPLALEALAYFQYLYEDLDGAERTWDRYLELVPEDPGGYNNKALIYKRRGEYVREEGLYRVALAMDPDDPVPMNNLAVCLAHQGRFDEALALMKKLEILDPDDAYADLHRAKIHAAMGQDDVALGFVARSLSRMDGLDIMHHVEFRQDIRVDPAFARLRGDPRFLAMLVQYYGDDIPVPE